MAFVKAIINLPAPQNAGKLLANWEAVNFSIITRFHEVSNYNHIIVLLFVPKI
jgi:hypothetical protein